MRNAGLPARVAEVDSETAFITDRAIEFLDRTPDHQRWCLHLSYIKPHWPYLAPDPYHALYTRDHVLPAVRADAERVNPHPVQGAFMGQDYSENFSRDEVRERVIPTYMGLVRQIDDHLGRLLRYLESRGLMERTLIAFTSDHGDYLGDHWLGEKDLFHDCSARIPMIICDPSPRADATRGTADDRFVEAVDLLPTFVGFAGGGIRTERVEGRSLLGLLRGEDQPAWRDVAVSEIDFSDRGPRTLLGVHPWECRAHMLRTDRWKYVFHERFRPQLFDLDGDPLELVDLGDDPGYESVRREMHERLFTWFRRRRNRTEMPEEILVRDGSGTRRTPRNHDRALVKNVRPGHRPPPSVPREGQNRVDQDLHRGQNQPRQQVELHPHLRADERRYDEQPDDDRHAVALQPRVGHRERPGQESQHHPTSVQRWKRQHV